VGLTIATERSVLVQALAGINEGNWLIEQRLVGRELSVGVVEGKAMGVVEIKPKSGVYDFASKYTKGATQYFAPAPLSDEVASSAQKDAEIAYAACGCRDYARVDFILCEQNGVKALYLLEINTLPGMKETSLLPMSARCVGLDFTALVHELVKPAMQRFSLGVAAKQF
jgi:D-alanine-D-alanine ligase